MLGFDLETYPIGPKRAPKGIGGAMNILDEEASKFQVDLWATRMKYLPDSKRSVYFFWSDKLDQFLQLCELVEGPVVAHNAPFDKRVMDDSLLAMNLKPLENEWICTKELSKNYLPNAGACFKSCDL